MKEKRRIKATSTKVANPNKDIAWTCDAIDREDTHILCCEGCGDLEFAVTGDMKTLKKLKRLWGGKIGLATRVSDDEFDGETDIRWGYLGDATNAVKTLSVLSKSGCLSEPLQRAVDDALDKWMDRHTISTSMHFHQTYEGGPWVDWS